MTGQDFSLNLSATGSAARGDDDTRYLAPPYNARLIEPQTVCLLISGETKTRELPLPLAQILGQCRCFRTLQAHAREIARALQQPSSSVPAIQQSLKQLVERGLLLSEADVLERLVADCAPRKPEPIEALFVRSCGRAETLRRLLDSLVARGLPDGLKSCIVLDDSRDADERARTRAVVSDFQACLPDRLQLIDIDQRRRLIEALSAGSGASQERLLWTIEGDADDPDPSYGASLNLALLLGAGSRMAMMDDDASFQAFELPGVVHTPAFRRSQSARIHFPEPEWTLTGDHYAALERHPLDCHAEMLGASGGDLARRANDDLRGLLEDIDPQLLHELSGKTRVRLTSSGTLGDPGTDSIQWLLAEEPIHLQPLCEGEARYLALIGQRRLARCAGRPQATTAFALMTTSLTGIDNRELLLPTQARGANEDLLFGALVDFLHPGSLQVGLPHMLFHQRPQPRQWQRDDFDRPRGIQRGGFLARQVERLVEVGQSLDPERRADLLGAMLRDLAASDDLVWLLERELLDTRADTIERIESTRSSLKPPPWLDRDFARSLAANRSITESDRQRLETLADRLPGFLERYTAALPDWRCAWEHARSRGLDELLAAAE